MTKLNPRFWRAFLLLALLAFLFIYNFSIVQKERLLAHGQSVVLRLAPVDPRSLMQGDYMILDFAAAEEARRAIHARYPDGAPRKGRMVLAQADGEHIFKRLDDGSRLEPGERLLEYSMGGGRIKIAGGSYFFEEGLAELYNYAVYGVLQVEADGKALISGLLDAHKRPLAKERWDAENRKLRED